MFQGPQGPRDLRDPAMCSGDLGSEGRSRICRSIARSESADGGGRFEPREVTTGLIGDHRMTEVVSGLSEGERVVTSGQFLIDSESQLQEALQKILQGYQGANVGDAGDEVWSCPMHPEVTGHEGGRCPECGMFLEQRPATLTETEERQDSEAAPGQYTCPMHPAVVQDEPGRCPDCGMFLEQVPTGEAEPE